MCALFALDEHQLPREILADRRHVAFDTLGFDVDLLQAGGVDGVGLVARVERREVGAQRRIGRPKGDEERLVPGRDVPAYRRLLVEKMNEHVTR